MEIESETGSIKPRDWEDNMGFPMPFEIVSTDIVIKNLDCLDSNFKVSVNDNNSKIKVNDLTFQLVKTKNNAGCGIHIFSEVEHQIEMEFDVNLKLYRKDIKPIFSIEKNEGDK